MIRVTRVATLLAISSSGVTAAQKERLPPEGTYAITFCYPTCGDSQSVVGTGTLVYVHDDILDRMSRGLVDSLTGGAPHYLRRDRPPNACFQVTAQRTVAGQEYYVGIIRASLTNLTPLGHDSASIGFYASPDAFFVAVVQFDSLGRLDGVGKQTNWDGSEAPLSRVTGHLVGQPDPRACVPSVGTR